MVKLCLTCVNEFNKSGSDFFSSTDVKIPLWFQQIGNYSLLPPPLNCKKKYNALKTTLKTTKIVDANYTTTFNLKKVAKHIPNPENKWIFFWAANKRDYLNISYPEAADAYGYFRNSGTVKSDSEGNVTIKCDNPKLYQVDDICYPPHLHFTYLKVNKTWSQRDTTIIATPELDIFTFRKLYESQKYLILNAMPNNLFKQTEIPYTYSLSYLTHGSTINRKISKYVKKYPKLKKIDNLKYLPIILYCKGDGCDASIRLINRLREYGYINLIYYPGGFNEYNKKILLNII